MTVDLPVRVKVLEVWDEIDIAWQGDMSVNELKRTALATTRVSASPTEFMVKVGGAEVLDEGCPAPCRIMASGVMCWRRRHPVPNVGAVFRRGVPAARSGFPDLRTCSNRFSTGCERLFRYK